MPLQLLMVFDCVSGHCCLGCNLMPRKFGLGLVDEYWAQVGWSGRYHFRKGDSRSKFYRCDGLLFVVHKEVESRATSAARTVVVLGGDMFLPWFRGDADISMSELLQIFVGLPLLLCFLFCKFMVFGIPPAKILHVHLVFSRTHLKLRNLLVVLPNFYVGLSLLLELFGSYLIICECSLVPLQKVKECASGEVLRRRVTSDKTICKLSSEI